MAGQDNARLVILPSLGLYVWACCRPAIAWFHNQIGINLTGVINPAPFWEEFPGYVVLLCGWVPLLELSPSGLPWLANLILPFGWIALFHKEPVLAGKLGLYGALIGATSLLMPWELRVREGFARWEASFLVIGLPALRSHLRFKGKTALDDEL
jgi:hypothetical protein